MARKLATAGVALASCVGLPCAMADVSYLSQTRTIEAATSFDLNEQTKSAVGFGPFIDFLDLSTPFPAEGGGTGTNAATSTINCILDPNAIKVSGSLAGEGGIAIVGGQPAAQFGEAAALVLVTFEVAAPTPFRMLASPRPSLHPKDEFEIELSNAVTGVPLFFIDATSPPTAVDFSGILAPGSYTLQYQVELTVDAGETIKDFTFSFTVPSPGAAPALAMGVMMLARRRR